MNLLRIVPKNPTLLPHIWKKLGEEKCPAETKLDVPCTNVWCKKQPIHEYHMPIIMGFTQRHMVSFMTNDTLIFTSE